MAGKVNYSWVYFIVNEGADSYIVKTPRGQVPTSEHMDDWDFEGPLTLRQAKREVARLIQSFEWHAYHNRRDILALRDYEVNLYPSKKKAEE